jgi:hypothetical protein
MSETPLVRELILSLLPLEGTDTLLPLQVLVNLHRLQLRRPLENMRHLFSAGELAAFEAEIMDPGLQLANRIERRYPELSGGLPYYSSLAVKTALHGIPAFRADPPALSFMEELSKTNRTLRRVITAALDGWVSYEPLVSLHQLTWNADTYTRRLPLLEAELSANPLVRDMILWLAAKDEARDPA